jgi:hypothetical protein
MFRAAQTFFSEFDFAAYFVCEGGVAGVSCWVDTGLAKHV